MAVPGRVLTVRLYEDEDQSMLQQITDQDNQVVTRAYFSVHMSRKHQLQLVLGFLYGDFRVLFYPLICMQRTPEVKLF